MRQISMSGELLLALLAVHRRTMPGAVYFPQPLLCLSSEQLFSLLRLPMSTLQGAA